jgi:hypothetical protein
LLNSNSTTTTTTTTTTSNSTRIGLKEPTGGVQNNPKFIYSPEPAPIERFTTETSLRYKTPKEVKISGVLGRGGEGRLGGRMGVGRGGVVVSVVSESGFSDGNRFRYTNNAKEDKEVVSLKLKVFLILP